MGLNKVKVSLLFLILITTSLWSQSVLIDPQGDGGFELSGGFSGNGWTLVNSSVNKWESSGISVPYQGNSAAFISPNGGADYVYDITSPSTSHLYKQVTVPSGENFINLNFWYKNPGEPLFDRLLVYTAPISVSPLVDAPQGGFTDIPGATLVYTDAASVYAYSNINLILPQSLAGTTFRLIFTWQNDNLDGTAIPASIDNISLTSQSSLYGGPLNGVYTIDNSQPNSPFVPTVGSNFNNFQDAISYLNTYGISGNVRFDVQSGQIFNHSPLSINVGGNMVDTIGFIRSGNGANPVVNSSGGVGIAGGDGAITLNGTDYISFDGIDVVTQSNPTTSVQNIENGFKITNASASNGATNNRIRNCSIYMNRLSNYTSNTGVLIYSSVTPTSNTGANHANEIHNVQIDNTVLGIRMNSNATYRDDQIKIMNCSIGAGAANSIGGITGQTYGIYIINAQNIQVTGNKVENVTTNGAVDGIFITGISGTSVLSSNEVKNIKNSLVSSTAVATGIRCVVASSSSLNLFNNTICGISVTYNNAPAINPAPILIKGLSVQPTGAVTSAFINIDFNSVSINSSTTPNVSSTCLEVIQTGPVVNIRNNIFVNSTASQTGFPFHYGMVVPNFSIAAATGVSNNNAVYISNLGNGVLIRKTSATVANYTSLPAWVSASTQDAQSVSADPVFVDPANDLHVFSSALDQTGDMTGITWVSDDMDGDARLSVPDIGADEFSMIAYDISVEAIISPDSTGCFGNNEQIILKIRNYAYQSIDFTINPLQVNVSVSGAVSNTYSITLNNNFLNNGQALGSLQYLEIPIGQIDLTSYGTYTFSASVFFAQDMVSSNDQLASPLVIYNHAPLPLPQNVPFEGFTSTNLELVYPEWRESESLYPVTNSSALIAASELNAVGNITALLNMNVGNNAAYIIGPKIVPSFNTFISFDLALTDAFSTVGNGQFDQDDTFELLISTDCGLTYQSIAIFNQDSLISNVLTNFELFLGAYEGQEIIPAFKVNDGSINGAAFGLHLDNINLFNSTAESISILSIIQPISGPCFSASEQIGVILENNGFVNLDLSQTPIQLNVHVNGSSVGSQSLSSGFIPINGTQQFYFPFTIDLSLAGQYALEIIAQLNSVSGVTIDSSEVFLYSQNPIVTSIYNDSLCVNTQAQILVDPVVCGITSNNLPRFEYIGPTVSIPDNDPLGIDIPIVVNGSGGFASQLIEIRIDSLLHGNLTHLKFRLKAPNGSSILLTQSNQGGGIGYLQTAFSANAINAISNANPPFTGTFSSIEPFSQLSGTPNGIWYLNVSDNAIGTTGSVFKWSMLLNEATTISTVDWNSINSISQETDSSLTLTASQSETIVYSLTDNNGCTVIDSMQLYVSEITLDSFQIQNVSCNGFSNGSIETSITGGFAPLNYEWNTNPVQNGVDVYNLSGGNYTLNIQDNIGCTNNYDFTIQEPSLLGATAIADTIFCDGCSANVAIFATGGTAPYSGIGLFDVFTAGTNAFTITDANGCSIELNVIVEDVSNIDNLGSDVPAVYPNPFDQFIQIEKSDSSSELFYLEDVNGKIVLEGYLADFENKLQTTSLVGGVYFIRIIEKNGKVLLNTKMVKL